MNEFDYIVGMREQIYTTKPYPSKLKLLGMCLRAVWNKEKKSD